MGRDSFILTGVLAIAAVGAVLGGTAGALVGAASAIETNKNYIKLSDQSLEQSETLVNWLNKNVLALS